MLFYILSVRKCVLPPGDNPTAVNKYIISIYIPQDATLHSLFISETALHVSVGTSTHHQERKQLYLQHLVFVTPLLLPAAIVEEFQPDALDTVVCAPDDGWRYQPKHVQQFPEINKLCKVPSCWIYIGIYLQSTEPWMLNLTL